MVLDQSLFTGVYRPSVVARYFRAEIGPKAYSWKLRRWARRGLAHPDLENFTGRNMIFTFEDLVSLRMVAIFRQYGHSLQSIRKAEEYFRNKTGDPLPFATRDMWVDRGDIFAEIHTHLVSGVKKKGQAAFSFLRENLDQVDLEFDHRDRANAWSPHRHVSLRPTVQFGQPCVTGTRVPTQMIWGMVEQGESVETVADDLALDVNKVRDACAWEQRLEAVA